MEALKIAYRVSMKVWDLTPEPIVRIQSRMDNVSLPNYYGFSY